MSKKTNIDIKKHFISNKPKYMEELRNEFNILYSTLKKFNPYEILSHLNTFFKMSLLNVYTEYDLDGSSISLKYTIEIIQMIISCIPNNEFKNEKVSEEDIYKIIDYGEKIYSLKIQYLVACTYEMYDEQSEISEYIFESEISSEITGKRYDIFEVQHYIDLFTPLRDYFEKTYGFSLETLFEGIDKLKRKFMFGINESRDEMVNIMEQFNGKELNESQQQTFYDALDKMFGLKLQNVTEITDWPSKFTDIFTHGVGENTLAIEDICFEKLYDLHKNINRKPLIKINDKCYYISIHRLLDNLDRIILKDLYKKNNQDIELIKSIVAKTCENLVGQYIKDIIPSAEVLTGNHYKINGKFCENDVLIIFENYLFIIEVKSGSFTPDVALNNLESHLISLKKLVEEADSQVNRFVSELEQKKILEIFESDDKKAKSKKIIKLDNYKEVFKLVITLEGFNEIEARADKVGILNLNKNIIVCSLDDLKVYSDYFKNNPTQFLHYMIYRRMATHSKGIELNDELDHLGLYIEHNCYPVTAKELLNEQKNIKNILWEGVREELDLYYNGKYIGGDRIVDKPIQEIPVRLNEIIQYVNSQPTFKNISSIGYLLDLGGSQKEDLFNNIEIFIEHYIKTGRIKYCFVRNHLDILTFISCIVNNNNFDESIVFDDVYANMKISNVKEAHILFLYYDENKKLIDITFNMLSSNDERYSSKEIDDIVVKIKERRFKKRNEKIGTKKIGRNEPCPCGSGLKYKKCCGR